MASVPNRWADDPPACQAGGTRKTELSVRSGGYGAMKPAKAAISNTSATMTKPASAPLLALKERQNSVKGCNGAGTVPEASVVVVIFGT